MEATPTEIRAAILSLAVRRGPGKTLCPSEVARLVGGEQWREAMPAVRVAAARLVAEGLLRATQRGCPVDPLEVRGAMRLGLPPAAVDDRGD